MAWNKQASSTEIKDVARSNKKNQDIINPCSKEHRISLLCLDQNDYNEGKCAKEILNYKSCKTFWYNVMKDRSKKGVEPVLPLPEDRERVKKEYFEKMKL